MALDRTRIVDSAFELLREQGLEALSMRRLATELGVAPAAIYWHVPSKQDLLAEVAERIVATLAPVGDYAARSAGGGPEAAFAIACDLRSALLGVRDGADVVSLALALRPHGLRPVRDIARLFSGQLPPQGAQWAARTLVHFVLGTVAEEQNRAELLRAGHVSSARERPAPDGGSTDREHAGSGRAGPDGDASPAFRFGVKAIILGVAAAHPPPSP